MKILFVTRKFPPGVGGMELFAADLYSSLLGGAEMKLVKWGSSNKWLSLVYPYLFLRSFFALLRGDFDVIHAQDGIVSLLCWALAKLFRKPLVVVLHGLDISYKNRLYQAIIPPAVRRADRVICISQATAEEAKKRGVNPDKIRVIPLAGADNLHGKSTRADLVRLLDLQPDAKILLTVGRLVRRKGVAWFIENVLPGLVKKYPEIIYLVVGEGAERSNIEAAVKKHGSEKHVRLLGRAKDALYEAAYNGADVFVMPNIVVPGDIEGFGLVLLEAALCKLPIVAADTEGIKDAVANGKNGILVPPGDAAAFAREITPLLEDPASVRTLAVRAREYTLANYSWDKVAASYLEEYKSILAKPPHSP